MSLSLSESIRLGAGLKPQGFDGRMNGPASCALAAACDAVGIPGLEVPFLNAEVINYAALERRFPIVGCVVRHPDFPVEDVLYKVIFFLNDNCGFTREQIADFVAEIEQAAAAESREVEVSVQ